MLAEISHYRVQEKIGEGGMGVVFRALDTRLNRPVALKFLTKESLEHAEARNRLLREARAASALNHSNIAVIHDIDDSIDHTFIAMEYVEGDTIRDRIKRGPLLMLDALDYTAQIADALSEAHSKLIVHRDIKSSNVVIKPNGQIKVLDFGLAKFQPPPDLAESQISTISTLTQTGSVIGTAAYMSPEQLRCQEIDGRSDIFSLGVVFYEMLSGRRPFERSTQVESFSATLHELPTPISDYIKDVPPSVSRILEKCLEKDKTKRYQTSAALRGDLLKAREEIVSGSVKFLDLVKTGKQKPRTWLAMFAATTAVVIATLGVLSYTAITGHWPWSLGPLVNLGEYKRIAVLPVRQLNKGQTKGDEDSEALGQTLTESLVAGLTKTKKFTVLTARATEAYRNSAKDEQIIGKELQIDGLIEPTMEESNGHLKVMVSLVRCKDKTSVWSGEVETFDRSLFTVQDRVLSLVDQMVGEPDRVAAASLGKRPSLNQQAVRYYELGKNRFNRLTKNDLDEAVGLYQRAITEDPNFSLAYAGLSLAYSQYIALEFETDSDRLDEADHAADQALKLDPSLPEGHFARGRAHYERFLYFNTGDISQVQKEIQESLDIDSEFAPALHVLMAIADQHYEAYGDPADLTRALDYYERANELEPNFIATEANVALILEESGRFDEAIAHLERLKSTAPGYTQVYGRLARVYAKKGDYQKAIEEMRNYLATNPDDPMVNAGLAVFLIDTNQFDEAHQHIQQAESSSNKDYSTEYYLTQAYGALRDKENCLKHFEAFAKLMEGKKYFAKAMVRMLEKDPNLELVITDPRFQTVAGNILK